MGKDFRSILPVTVKQHSDIESFFDEISVACFLVAAITQVTFMLQDLEFVIRRQRFQANSQFVGCILAGIIENDYFFNIFQDTGWYSLQYLGQSRNGVIGNYENADTPTAIRCKPVG